MSEKETTQAKRVGIRSYTGIVTSTKTAGSVSVQVEFKKIHPQYKKRIRTHKKFLAHDAAGDCFTGDTVKIVACRPISKRKSWIVKQILKKSEKATGEHS